MSTQNIGRKSRQLLGFVILLNLAAIGVYGFLFMEIKAKNEHISDLVNRIEAEAEEESAQGAKRALVAETAALREKLAGYTVQKEGAVGFIELLETTGSFVGARVSIESVVPAALPALPEMETLRFTLKVTGSWSSVVRLFGLLELLPYESDVEQVVIAKTGQARGDPWRADLSLSVLKEK